MRPIGIGLIGFGTIGTGVVKVVRNNAAVIEQRLGFPLRMVRIADLDTETDRGVDLTGIGFDSDADGLLADPDVDIVIELIGGYDVAKRMILRAIEQGKHVATANKALLALHGKEIFDAARKQGVDVGFEAAVAGGIPILRSLREGLAANNIESLHGILNGTTNYVLSEMESTGEDFEVVLKRAQELGYAEADPTYDVEGIDAAHKLALLTAMAYGAELTYEDIPTEGIRGVKPIDIEMAAEFGYRIKLLGIARVHGSGAHEQVEARVHPTLVPASSLLAKVDGAMNAVEVHGDAAGPTLYYGAGAGEMPTASAVVGDLMEIAREIQRGAAGRVAPLSYAPGELVRKAILPLADLECRCFIRFSVQDHPGALGQIASVLGENGIGIESIVQRGSDREGGAVSVLLFTHTAKELALRRALQEIDAMADVVTAPSALIRIEEDV